MKIIVFPDNLGYPATLPDEPFADVGELRYFNDLPSETEFVRRSKDANAIILAWIKMTPHILNACPNLEIISFMGIGVSNYVDLPHAAARGITICNAPHYGDHSIAEHTLMLILALARKVILADKSVRAGAWEQEKLEGSELHGKTLGIVGLGGVGSKVAALGNALGMTVICHTSHPSPSRAKHHHIRFVGIDELLQSADVVSLHLATTSETKPFIGSQELAQMKTTALFINTARAELVDTTALAEAVRIGVIAGAATDVWNEEPPQPSHPLLIADNVVLTPHIAWNTTAAKSNILSMCIENVRAFFLGKSQNVVTL